MTKEENITKAQQLREAYLEYLTSLHKDNPEALADFTEKELVAFIRKHVDSAFTNIYEQLNHKFYEGVRKKSQIDTSMKAENDACDNMYSQVIKLYSNFLQSKYFPQPTLPKEKKQKTPQASQQPSVPDERPMTEGEKKHVEYEAAHRNLKLRKACIEKYGYQCQCCGMDFAKAYGEELGSRFIEVHHLKMISSFDGEHQVDPLEDLVPLCSNCHSMIHHGPDGPLTLNQLRDAYHGPKWEIKVWKD